MSLKTDKYSSYAELSKNEAVGVDYEIVTRSSMSGVLIVAPHGGGIEPGTSWIAKKIAGENFSLYCFNGLKHRGNSDLHITSHLFDEPRCIEMLKQHDVVITIHGCQGDENSVHLGGLDDSLVDEFNSEITRLCEHVNVSRKFPGREKTNICNMGRTSAGVQFELTRGFRDNPAARERFIEIVRGVVLKRISN